MLLKDTCDLPVSGATPASVAAFDRASGELACFIDDPMASVDRALAESPAMTMAHALKAWLHLLGTEPAGRAIARACCETAARLPATERERGHVAAATALADGRWREAGRVLEDVSAAFPTDLLALQVGHQIDFFRGDSRMLRDRIARALPAWDPARPRWHALLGMYAFGLEETADYAAAERYGRRAVELEPRDGWAWHAVAHVHEMRNAVADGIRWLQPHRETWATGSFFAVHNTWHLALFLLESGDVPGVLALYDEAIGGTGSTVVLDLIDATAMLWRLKLRGVDVGDRWSSLADRWHAVGGLGQYAFNDVHALMAFVGAGRDAERTRVLDALRHAGEADDDNGEFSRRVGIPVARAIVAFSEGKFESAADLLRTVRNGAHAFGGSHAQRDVIDLTLLESARHGAPTLYRALCAERAALRPSGMPATTSALDKPVRARASAANASGKVVLPCA